MKVTLVVTLAVGACLLAACSAQAAEPWTPLPAATAEPSATPGPLLVQLPPAAPAPAAQARAPEVRPTRTPAPPTPTPFPAIRPSCLRTGPDNSMPLFEAVTKSTLVVSTLPVRNVNNESKFLTVDLEQLAFGWFTTYEIEVDRYFKGAGNGRFTLLHRSECRLFPMEDGERFILLVGPVGQLPNTYINISSVYRLKIVDGRVQIVGMYSWHMADVEGISEAELIKRIEDAVRDPATRTPTPTATPYPTYPFPSFSLRHGDGLATVGEITSYCWAGPASKGLSCENTDSWVRIAAGEPIRVKKGALVQVQVEAHDGPDSLTGGIYPGTTQPVPRGDSLVLLPDLNGPFRLDIPPGRYVLDVHAGWPVGAATARFLIEVIE
ncbi:MAG: hypothetical protein FJ319_05850 [SAR202 cluster bacterium]|nr:hypothetical protein [SAR202 cluster bacterium]